MMVNCALTSEYAVFVFDTSGLCPGVVHFDFKNCHGDSRYGLEFFYRRLCRTSYQSGLYRGFNVLLVGIFVVGVESEGG